jgi:cytochrome c-type biogenesis protein CcmH
MVCQNQTIAESNAGLAVDLKKQVAKQINEGKTDDQILNFMEERYGEFVLYNPPVSLENSLLWLTPFVVLIIAVLILISALKRQNKSND